MIVFNESVEIEATPEALFQFAGNLEENYKLMSDKFVQFKMVKGDPISEGSVFYLEEVFGDKRLGGKYRVKRIIPNQLIEWEVLFPKAMTSGRFMMFIIEKEGRIELKELIMLGKDSPLLGKAVDWSINHVLMPYCQEFFEHQKEGMQNIKEALEQSYLM